MVVVVVGGSAQNGQVGAQFGPLGNEFLTSLQPESGGGREHGNDEHVCNIM